MRTPDTRLGKLGSSRMGLGLAALGRPGYINLGHGADLADGINKDAMKHRAHAVLDAAYACGIRYFDAARSYGNAESYLGEWLNLRGHNAPEVTVGSKWGYVYTANWQVDADVHEVKNLSLGTLQRQFVESDELLAPNMRLYQIHSATIESGILEDRRVLDELARLRTEGLLIGLSVTGPAQAETIERALEVGGFDAVQATWNLLERSAGPALAAAHDAGLSVIVKEALANGRLSARGDIPEVIGLARRMECTPDALALAAALAQPWADIVLSGATTLSELASNAAARALEIEPEIEERLDVVRQDSAAYWSARSALPWN